MTEGPDVEALGRLAAEHLPPILYALELCAVQMDHANRPEEAVYYRELAKLLAEAAAGSGGQQEAE